MASLRLTFPAEPGTPPLITTVLNGEAHLVARTTLSPRNRSELLELAPGDYLVQVERPSGPPLQRTARLKTGEIAEPNLSPDRLLYRCPVGDEVYSSPGRCPIHGNYLVQVERPSGPLLQGTARLETGSLRTAPSLNYQIPNLFSSRRGNSIGIFRRSELPISQRPRIDVHIRLWTRTGSAWVPVPPTGLTPTTAAGTVCVSLRTGAEPAHALQLAGRDLPSRIIMLPGFETCMTLMLNRDTEGDQPADVTVSLSSADDLLDSLVQTLAAFAPPHTAEIWEHAADDAGVLAERALFGKRDDPARAALGGYYLLRFGMLDRLHDWPENLDKRFPTLADGPVIHGWQYLRDERLHDLDKATNRLIEAAQRGIPVFAEGLRLLVDGLRLIIRARPNRLDAIDALERVGLYLVASAPVSAYTAFFGTAPDRPTAQPQGLGANAAMPASGMLLVSL